MSSPIAKKSQDTNIVHKIINLVHKKLSHNHRVEVLSVKLATHLRNIVGNKKNVICLDVGCGDLGIMERLSEEVQGTVWQCMDIYDLPEYFENNSKWSTYRKFDGKNLPLDDDSVDIILFCDMLHHANNYKKQLLMEARRVGKTIIVKDSFEYSCYSRLMLKIADFIGNWGYGVPLPEEYFTITKFKSVCDELKFEIVRLEIGIQIYGHLPIIRKMLRPEWHFIAVLEKH